MPTYSIVGIKTIKTIVKTRRHQMRPYTKVVLALLFSASIVMPIYPQTFPNMTEKEYTQAQTQKIREEMGLVVENQPQLGYLTYVNAQGKTIVRQYHKNQVKVEKAPHYEVEDLIGYIDEMFPSFEFDPRDTTAEHLQPGDYIYIYLAPDQTITHISASTNHIMRYGKVKQFTPGGMAVSKMLIEDERGQLFHLEIDSQVPVSKAGIPISISQIQEGDWVKVLISQGTIAPGYTSEYVREVAVDRGSRHISSIYRGQITHIDPYQSNLYLQNTQPFGKDGWGSYTDIKELAVKQGNTQSYHRGNLVSWDYVTRYLKHQPGYVYIAMEDYYGSERAVKLDFQSIHQRTLPASTIISAQPGLIKLMSGEEIGVSQDAIIRRNGRLVDPYSIMTSDYAQVVVTGENKAAVIDITQKPTRGNLQIFRGRIKKIQDRETFEVETFSLLDDTLWMYHPIPRTFTVDNRTIFYDESGIWNNGIEEFLGYGENTQIQEVYTAIVEGDFAQALIKMPYTKHSVRGEIYESSDNGIKIKDTYIYHLGRKRWEVKGRKDNTQNISLAANAAIMKNGKLISPKSLVKGDKIHIMTDIEPQPEMNTDVEGYLIIVEE